MLLTTPNIEAMAADISAAFEQTKNTVNNSLSDKLKDLRNFIVANADDVDFDAAISLLLSVRNSEIKTAEILKPLVGGLDSYVLSQSGKRFKEYFKDYTNNTPTANAGTWPENFRKLWRIVKNEELNVKLGIFENISGVWSYTPYVAVNNNHAIEIPQSLELRVSAPLLTNVVFNIKLARTIADNTTEGIDLVTVTLISGSTSISIPTANSSFKWVKVSTTASTPVAVTGGANTNIVELWTK